jgi:general secretion pathway protein G
MDMGPARVIAELPILNLCLPVAGALAAVAAFVYLISRFRSRRAELTFVDLFIVAVIVTIVGATAIPLVEAASRQIKTTTLRQNLHTLRSQIELYKTEHGGKAPLLFEGTFPQLTRATNSNGVPGPPGSKHPYGPYLRTGIPVNPITGRSIVSPTKTFPPTNPSGNGGWIYHQGGGHITADLAGFLTQ